MQAHACLLPMMWHRHPQTILSGRSPPSQLLVYLQRLPRLTGRPCWLP
jgi:hypothetical protein